MSASARPKPSTLFSPKSGSGWNIVAPSIHDYLQGLAAGKYLIPLDAQFSNLSNALRNEHEIAEIAAATGEGNIHQLITYPSHRLALLETVAIIETEVRMHENDLEKIVQDIYRNIVRPAIKDKKTLQADCQKTSAELARAALRVDAAKDTPYIELAKTIQARVQERFNTGKYKPHEHFEIMDQNSDKIEDQQAAVAEITFRAVVDKIYQQIANEAIDAIVEPIIAKQINDKYQWLTKHAGNECHTFMLLGPPACGKGTSIIMLQEYAKKKLQIDWDDVVKIDTDAHRKIVSRHMHESEVPEISERLNGDEATYITQRAYFKMSKKIGENLAPHLLIDGVKPAMERFMLGTDNQRVLHLLVVTAPVPISIERAYKRGQESG